MEGPVLLLLAFRQGARAGADPRPPRGRRPPLRLAAVQRRPPLPRGGAPPPRPSRRPPAALADAPPAASCPQAQLADRLSEILTQLSEAHALLYFRCFMDTMRREWFGIDRLRLDKFLLLVRRFVARMFVGLARRGWAGPECALYAGYLRDAVLLPQQSTGGRALGVAYQLADVFLPELIKVAGEAPPPAAALAALLQPFGAAMVRAGEQATLDRIRCAAAAGGPAAARPPGA
jgi:hypothetical protein